MKIETIKRTLITTFSLLAVLSIATLSGCATTPAPFESAELEAIAENNLQQVNADQQPVTGPITMYEAMARALRYNLDYKVELMTQMLRSKEHNLARYDMLPTLVANSAYIARDTFGGASSSRLESPTRVGSQSLVASTSAEREFLQHDAEISWDILDFGLSYIRAKQKGDDILIAQEQKRKVANRIIEDVRTAYWRAVSAERLVKKLASLEGEVDQALTHSRRTHSELQVKPLEALTYQRELMETKQEVQQLQRDLIIAKQQLAALMNLKPEEEFELVLPERDIRAVRLNIEGDDMVTIALNNRPEMREIAYRRRINEREATAALLDLLPSLRIHGGFNYDDNSFLFNNSWANWGAKASWNLLEAFRYPARKKTVAAQDALFYQRSLALTMAVITQVHVSRIRFEHAYRQVKTMQELHHVQENILEQINAGYAAKRVSQQSLIREKMNTMIADAKYDIALATLHNAFANVYASMGINPYGDDVVGNEDIADMTNKLQAYWARQGDQT